MFLMKDASKICGIAQKKYGPSVKIGLNYAFSESQKRKKSVTLVSNTSNETFQLGRK